MSNELPMTDGQRAAIERLALQSGAELAIDWVDLDRRGTSFLIQGLRARRDEYRAAHAPEPCDLCGAVAVPDERGWVTDHAEGCGWELVIAAEYVLDGVTPA